MAKWYLAVLGSPSPEPHVFGLLEPVPLEKKTGAGAAWKKHWGWIRQKYAAPEPAPRRYKHKEIEHLLHSLGKILAQMN